jgi:hypothetical protein
VHIFGILSIFIFLLSSCVSLRPIDQLLLIFILAIDWRCPISWRRQIEKHDQSDNTPIDSASVRPYAVANQIFWLFSYRSASFHWGPLSLSSIKEHHLSLVMVYLLAHCTLPCGYSTTDLHASLMFNVAMVTVRYCITRKTSTPRYYCSNLIVNMQTNKKFSKTQKVLFYFSVPKTPLFRFLAGKNTL